MACTLCMDVIDSLDFDYCRACGHGVPEPPKDTKPRTPVELAVWLASAGQVGRRPGNLG